MKILKLIIITVLFCSCLSPKNNSEGTKTIPKESATTTVLRYQKTSCYGRCPSFVFKLKSDLSCELDSSYFFIAEGNNKGKITQEQYNTLIEKIKKAGIYDFKDNYDDTLKQDVPSTYITVNLDHKIKKIHSRSGSPVALLNLQSDIDAFIKSIKWEKVEN